jgi:hypothetical protein
MVDDVAASPSSRLHPFDAPMLSDVSAKVSIQPMRAKYDESVDSVMSELRRGAELATAIGECGMEGLRTS